MDVVVKSRSILNIMAWNYWRERQHFFFTSNVSILYIFRPLQCVWLDRFQEQWKIQEGKWGGKVGFPLFGIGWKIEGVENPGEKFLSRAHKFFPPKSGGKSREENCVLCNFTRMPSTNPSFKAFTYPTEDFCPNDLSLFLIFFSLPSAHRPLFQVLSSLFFFF